MRDMNSVVLVGHLTRDAELAYIDGGNTPCSKFAVACNGSRKIGTEYVDEVNYFDVTIWGKTAENLKQYLLKGKQIAVDGYLRQDRWQKDGQNFSKVVVVANNVQLLGGNTGQTQSAPVPPQVSEFSDMVGGSTQEPILF